MPNPKLKSVGNGLYRGDDGSFWERPTIKGRRTWRKIKASNLKAARAFLDATNGLRATEFIVDNWVKANMPEKRGGFDDLPPCLREHGTGVKVFWTDEAEQGIYFLMDRGRCVYVGISKGNIQKRILEHKLSKNYQKAFYLPMEGNFDKLLEVERHYIELLKPEYNRMYLKVVPSREAEAV